MIRVRAAVVEDEGQLPVFQDVDLAEPAYDEVLVRVAATGICHTDVAWARGEIFPTFPVVLGHETSGVVEAVGSGVTRVAKGDRVVVSLTHHCGHCRFCEAGHPMLCARRTESPPRITREGTPVFQGFGVGGFAEAIVVREVSCIRVPDAVPLEVAALVGCAVATGVGAALNVARVTPGSKVVVLGSGGIGISVVMGAALAGAEQIVVVEPSEDRRHRALKLGATAAVAPASSDLVELAGEGFDFAFESVGTIPTMQETLRLTRRGGTAVLIGAPDAREQLAIPALDFVSSQKRLLGCLTGDVRPNTDFDRYFRLYLSGKLDLDALITGTVPFERIQEGFKSSAEGQGIRTILTP